MTLSAFTQSSDTTSEITINGIGSGVTVTKDARGIPYIKASSEADLYFMQGYLTAKDRLWQFDLMRRLARGETAEIFGERTLEEDKRWRRFGFAKIAEDSLTKLSPELQKALADYSRGVNAYISSLTPETYPVEFRILQYKPREWSPADSLILGKILSDALSTTWQNDLMRMQLRSLPKDKLADLMSNKTPYDVILFGKDATRHRSANDAFYSSDKLSDKAVAAAEADMASRDSGLSMVGLYAEGLAASNNWVLSGKLTSDGKPLLANDPHLAPTAPGIWYLVELSAPGLHTAGVSLPGVPGIVLGHNDSIAWGATNVGPDVQDLYLETFNEKGEYKTPSGWSQPSKRNEVINVRQGLATAETKPVNYEVTETRNGVIMIDDGGKKYSLKWTARDPGNSEFEAFFKINRAKNWAEFTNALKTYGGATQNFIYADVKGHIGWYAAGRIPIRRKGDGSMPYDGATNDGDWIGMIPFAELPHLYDPPSGMIVTANQRIAGDTYKYPQIGRDVATPWRALSIVRGLTAKGKNLTMDDVRDIQLSSFNIPLDALSRRIVDHKAASQETLEVLSDWDGKMTPDSRGSVLVNEIRTCVAVKMASESKPAPASVIRERIVDRAVSENWTRWLPAGYADYNALLKDCDGITRRTLSDPKQLGPDASKWTWGRIFMSKLDHPLAAVPFVGAQFKTPRVPIAGSAQTPNVGSNVSMRFIASPGNWDATRHVISLGESGDPKSPHFRDQFELWRTGDAAVFPFSEKAAAAAATETIRYVPK